MKFIDEFKNFAFKGNVIDMAVGIVVGGAFSAIVNALVTYIIMPLISYGTAGLDFTDMKIVLRPAAVVDGVEVAECAIGYGQVIQSIIYFLLVSLALFIVLKIIFNFRSKVNAAAGATATALKKPAPASAAPLQPQTSPEQAQAAADQAALDAASKAASIEAREANIELLLSEIRDLLKNQSNNQSANNS